MKTKRFERVCSITIHWTGKTKYTILIGDLMRRIHQINIFKRLHKLQICTILKGLRLKIITIVSCMADLPRSPDFGIGDHRLRSTESRSVAFFWGGDS